MLSYKSLEETLRKHHKGADHTFKLFPTYTYELEGL
jgi:hypothetical protein